MQATRRRRTPAIKGRFARGASLPFVSYTSHGRFSAYGRASSFAERQAAEYARVVGRAHVNRFTDAGWNSAASASQLIERIAA